MPAVPAPEVMYHPIFPHTAPTERNSNSSSSSNTAAAVYVMGEERKRKPETRAGWWWQRGPVDTCCFGFSLRVGVCLIALLENMRAGVWCLLLKGMTNAKLVAALDSRRESFVLYCGPRTNQFCREIGRGIMKSEAKVDILLAQEPLYRLMGVVLVMFSLLGLRAAYTQGQAEAKLYSAIFPLFLCFRAMIIAQSLGTASGTALTMEAAYALSLVYYFKVARSFYTRCRAAKERRSSAETASRRESGVQLGRV